jgi:hypothetical protein
MGLGYGLLLLLVLGCGTKPPKTYPAGGRVVRGDQPMTVGVVEFRSRADRSIVAIGELQSDGRFTLTTIFEGQRLPGAVEGEHEVTVIPPLSDLRSGSPSVLTLSRSVQSNAKNDFEITLDPPR